MLSHETQPTKSIEFKKIETIPGPKNNIPLLYYQNIPTTITSLSPHVQSKHKLQISKSPYLKQTSQISKFVDGNFKNIQSEIKHQTLAIQNDTLPKSKSCLKNKNKLQQNTNKSTKNTKKVTFDLRQNNHLKSSYPPYQQHTQKNLVQKQNCQPLKLQFGLLKFHPKSSHPNQNRSPIPFVSKENNPIEIQRYNSNDKIYSHHSNIPIRQPQPSIFTKVFSILNNHEQAIRNAISPPKIENRQ